VNFQHKDLAYAVDDAIATALANGRIAAIFKDWGVTFERQRDNPLASKRPHCSGNGKAPFAAVIITRAAATLNQLTSRRPPTEPLALIGFEPAAS
jgi:hypothetical protein